MPDEVPIGTAMFDALKIKGDYKAAFIRESPVGKVNNVAMGVAGSTLPLMLHFDVDVERVTIEVHDRAGNVSVVCLERKSS